MLRGCEVCGAWESALRTLNHLTRHQPVGVQLDPQLYHAVLRTLCAAGQWGEAKGLIKRLHKHGLLTEEVKVVVAAGPRSEAARELFKYIHYMLHKDDEGHRHWHRDKHRHTADDQSSTTDASGSPPRRPRQRDALTREGDWRRPPVVVVGWQEAETTPPPTTRPPKPSTPAAATEPSPSPRRRQRQREAKGNDRGGRDRDEEDGDFKGRRQQRKR